MSRAANCAIAVLVLVCLAGAGVGAEQGGGAKTPPQAADPRLVVELLASAPEIVHPVKLACDPQGGVLVIESHTHFRPKDYAGPPHDRIRRFDFSKPAGDPARVTTFFEGTDATMDIAVHPDGSVYLATRNEILRLRDTKKAGTADEKKRIAFLDTKGNYPHNGLEGLCFDAQGGLRFGMGENLGENYTLTGSDGRTLTGGGEGGNIYACSAEGKQLRRVATGFWNPFGMCRDIFGRYFAVDNDPDAMPPCRMLQIVEGGDYGYQFRYGRTGRHPFQSWNGQLFGTLPYVTGVGEAPCTIFSYESDGLPAEYRGQLLVTSWADHRIERYELVQRGASVQSQTQVLVQGGGDFRPNGMAVAADGSLYVCDWVLADYNLHGKGAIWRISWKDRPAAARPEAKDQALSSAHRPLRDAAATALAASEEGRKVLAGKLRDADLRVRAAAVDALGGYLTGQADAAEEAGKLLSPVAEKDESPALRAAAARILAAALSPVRSYEDGQSAEVRAEAVLGFRDRLDIPWLIELAADEDPFLRHAAVRQLAGFRQLVDGLDLGSLANGQERAGVLLALRMSGRTEAVRRAADFLADEDDLVRFLAIKWVADDKLTTYRPQIEELMKNPKLTALTYMGLVTAATRLEGKEVTDARLIDFFADRLADEQSAAEVKVRALQLVPVTHARLKLAILEKLVTHSDAAIREEAVRALCEHPDAGRLAVLKRLGEAAESPNSIKAWALVGLASGAEAERGLLLKAAVGGEKLLRGEALRSLVGVKLSPEEQKQLSKLAMEQADAAPLVARVLGEGPPKDRPKSEDVNGWLARLVGPADAEAGRRLFFHPKLAYCGRCHRAEGRGADIGPDLSTIGQRPRRHIVESIVQPSAAIAPHYQPWQVTTRDGLSFRGMLINTYLDEDTYLNEKGEKIKVKTTQIETVKPSPVSIMPAGLVDLLTDQELRDITAYLSQRR